MGMGLGVWKLGLRESRRGRRRRLFLCRSADFRAWVVYFHTYTCIYVV